jgi:hypothetical protein
MTQKATGLVRQVQQSQRVLHSRPNSPLERAAGSLIPHLADGWVRRLAEEVADEQALQAGVRRIREADAPLVTSPTSLAKSIQIRRPRNRTCKMRAIGESGTTSRMVGSAHKSALLSRSTFGAIPFTHCRNHARLSQGGSGSGRRVAYVPPNVPRAAAASA